MLRTSRSPFRHVWRLGHLAVMRVVAGYLRQDQRDLTVYVKGSFASAEPLYGISDIDLIVVTPDATGQANRGRNRTRERWARLARGVPPLRRLVKHLWVYEQSELARAAASSCLTFGLDAVDPSSHAAFLGPRSLKDAAGLLDRPSVFGLAREWRRLSGAERRPPARLADRASRIVSPWLELQHWWRYAFGACLRPEDPQMPYLCVKLVAEPLRLWLWLERGTWVPTRSAALERGLRELPEEEAALRLALDLFRNLPRSPAPPLAELLPAFVRLSERLAGTMEAAARAAGGGDVRLIGTTTPLALGPGAGDSLRTLMDGTPVLLPLVDWRARAVPAVPDEAFALVPGDAAAPAAIAAAARAGDPAAPAAVAAAARAGISGPYPALRTGRLMVLPTNGGYERTALRGVQSAVTDPVSFALVEGAGHAHFPDLPGWSARDAARRAVAEHRAWVHAGRKVPTPHGWVGVQPGSGAASLRTLGLLFTAARAALFQSSVESGEPELPLTVAAVADRLAERREARAAVDAALEAFLESRRLGNAPPAGVVGAFRSVVVDLPGYAGVAAAAA